MLVSRLATFESETGNHRKKHLFSGKFDSRRQMQRFFQCFAAAVIASLPSEPFVEIGLILRRSIFNDRLCLVTSHGNSNGGKNYGGGYIPNSWNYGRGGYESTPRSSGYSIHTADILLANWRKLAEK